MLGPQVSYGTPVVPASDPMDEYDRRMAALLDIARGGAAAVTEGPAVTAPQTVFPELEPVQAPPKADRVMSSPDVPPGVIGTPVRRPDEERPETASGRGMAPLTSLDELPARFKPATVVGQMAVPPVVAQILGDHPEHWYHLAMGLRQRQEVNGLTGVLVTGSLSGEGYTTLAVALAIAAVNAVPQRVLLVEGDYAAPSLAATLGLRPTVGLEEVLLEGAPVEQALIHVEKPAVDVLPIRNGFDHPATVVDGGRMAEVMAQLRTHYDLVVVDGGPLFSGRCPVPTTAGIDACLIVRQPALSNDHLLTQLERYLADRGLSCLGVIENAVA